MILSDQLLSDCLVFRRFAERQQGAKCNTPALMPQYMLPLPFLFVFSHAAQILRNTAIDKFEDFWHPLFSAQFFYAT
jgi:hypothetical protein